MGIATRLGAGLSRVSGLRRQVEERVDRARVTGRVAYRTGLLGQIRAPGARVLLEAFVTGKQSPSTLFRFHAKNTPHKTALVYRDQRFTFAELDGLIDRVAAGLRARGAGRGTSGIVMLKNRPEFFLLQAAMSRLGGAAVSVSWRSTPDELTYLVENSGASFLFVDLDAVAVADASRRRLGLLEGRCVVVGGEAAGYVPMQELTESRAPVAADESEEAAVVIYTSGTTGKPKGAVRKFPREALGQVMRFLDQTPLRHDDVHLAVCPLYHSTAFGFASFSFVLGNTVVLLDEFKPEGFLEAVEKHRATQTAVVPTMLHRLVGLGRARVRQFDTRSLSAVFVGGAQLPGPVATEVLSLFGDVLYNFYGATETGLVTLARPEDLRRSPTTIGRAIPGNEIRLLDEDGGEVSRGEVGELYVKSLMLVEGYHRDERATRSSMREGFFSVGDLARQDERGCYFIEGRKRDMIISGGVNVYPAEVEGALEEHPEIDEVAVVGAPDPEWGERVRAFVVKKPGASLDEAQLKAYCREKLSGPKQPREFFFLDRLPRNPTGKVLKRELRQPG